MAGAAYASIRLTRDAADAAAKTLSVVTEAYARGAVSILDLLDAQNAARTTEEAAAIAVYKFLSDYTRMQRALGQFDVFLSEEEKREMIDRLERFILENGGALPQR
jgi:outer membrane protein TolC